MSLYIVTFLAALAAQGPSGASSLKIDSSLSAAAGLSIAAGENRLLTLSEEIIRVSVANPDVADLKVITPRQILVTGKAVGTTDLSLWNRSNEPLIVALQVHGSFDGLDQQLRQLFPGERIQVSSVGDLIVLSGEVSDLRLPERIAEVARLHGQKVANLIQVAGNQQVQLEVRFAEVSRSGLREAGLNVFHRDAGAQRVGGMSTPSTSPGGFLNTGANPSIPGAGARSLTGAPPDVYAPSYNNAFSIFFSQAFDKFPFSATLSLLESNGLAKVLAEPTLTTLTGQQAKFLAGGEIPIPISAALGQVEVQWKKFGIVLEFTPTVLDARTIQLELSTEVSELDPNLAVSFGGGSVPGFSSRQGETTVRLGDGQSFAIAGLLSEKTRSTVAKVPLLGDIPVLGALFRSTAYQRDETELLVVVTARLAKPMDPGQAGPLPGELETHPNDFQLFLLGAQTGRRRETPLRPKPSGPIGFVR